MEFTEMGREEGVDVKAISGTGHTFPGGNTGLRGHYRNSSY